MLEYFIERSLVSIKMNFFSHIPLIVVIELGFGFAPLGEILTSINEYHTDPLKSLSDSLYNPSDAKKLASLPNSY